MDVDKIFPEDVDKVRQVLTDIMGLLVPAVAATGITCTEVEAIVADRFIKHVHTAYGLRNRKTNVSRIALISGHSRKVAGAIARSPAPTSFEHISGNQSAVYRVIAAWLSEPGYVDVCGQPRVLEWIGPRSLYELICSVGGDVPAGAIRHEMIRHGYVLKRDDGSFELTEKRKPDGAVLSLNYLCEIADLLGRNQSANNSTFWHYTFSYNLLF